MHKKVTLSDVARAAGVALGTASRVINNFTDVDPTTRQRVLSTVERLRYRPLRARKAPGLDGAASRKARNIGLILLGMDDSLVHVPVLTEIVHGVESAIAEINGNLLLANLPDATRVPAFLRDNQVDGLLIKISQYSELPSASQHPLVSNLLRFPIIWMWGKPAGAPGDLCTFNHETAAALVTAELERNGHKRVAFLNPKKGKSSLEHMKKEFRFACEAHSFDFSVLESATERTATWPEPAITGPEEILPLVDEWAAIPKSKRPTAIFVPADNIAVHLYAALEERGFKVAKDVSVIACNHEKALVRSFHPALTTLDVSAGRIGAKSVAQLLTRLENRLDTSAQTFLFEPTLVPGASVARI
jgi:LacI family transcriptional regulator